MPGPLAVAGIAAGGSALLNMFSGNAAAGRMTKLRQQLMELFSTQRLGSETNDLYSLFKSSPMYAGLRSRAMEGASTLGGQLQTSFARAGLGRTGIAATALPLARSSFTRGFQDIDANLFVQALQQARQMLTSRAGALQGTAGPSGTELGLGNTMQSIMPLLLMLMQGGGGKGGGGVSGPTMGQPGFVYPMGGR
jgi:hypothetical protein